MESEEWTNSDALLSFLESLLPKYEFNLPDKEPGDVANWQNIQRENVRKKVAELRALIAKRRAMDQKPSTWGGREELDLKLQRAFAALETLPRDMIESDPSHDDSTSEIAAL